MRFDGRVRMWVAIALGLVAGAAGVGGMLGLKHVWQDHLALHELATIEVQRQGAQGAK